MTGCSRVPLPPQRMAASIAPSLAVAVFLLAAFDMTNGDYDFPRHEPRQITGCRKDCAGCHGGFIEKHAGLWTWRKPKRCDVSGRFPQFCFEQAATGTFRLGYAANRARRALRAAHGYRRSDELVFVKIDNLRSQKVEMRGNVEQGLQRFLNCRLSFR